MSTYVHQGQKGKLINGAISAVNSATGVPMIISDEQLLQQNLFPAWSLSFSLGSLFNDAENEEDKEDPASQAEKDNPSGNQQFVLLLGTIGLVALWLWVRR